MVRLEEGGGRDGRLHGPGSDDDALSNRESGGEKRTRDGDSDQCKGQGSVAAARAIAARRSYL